MEERRREETEGRYVGKKRARKGEQTTEGI